MEGDIQITRLPSRRCIMPWPRRWWRLGKVCGFQNGHLLYWLRFLNLLVVAALVSGGFVAARLGLPDNPLFTARRSSACWLSFRKVPFTQFKMTCCRRSVLAQALICLVRLWEAEIPGARLGAAAGLALAAVFLTKISNLPLLAVSGVVVLLKIRHLAKGAECALATALAALAFVRGAAGDRLAGVVQI